MSYENGLAVDDNVVFIELRLFPFSWYLEQQVVGVLRLVCFVVLVVWGLSNDIGANLLNDWVLNWEILVQKVALSEETQNLEMIFIK